MKHKAKRLAAGALGLALGLQFSWAAAPTAGYENGADLNLTQIAQYVSGQFNVDGGVMEIVTYNTRTGWAYAINGQSGLLAAIELDGLTASGSVTQLTGEEIDIKALVEAEDATFQYGDMTSVAISPDQTMLAAALQAEGYDEAGRVALFTCQEDGTLTLRGLVEAGVQPDMVTFADDNTVLTADEGEPRQGYGEGVTDPRGSVTIVDTDTLTSSVVGFDAFDSQRDALVQDGVVLKKDTAPSVDLEPEYIAVSEGKAYVTLQEANAIAVLDIETQRYDGVYAIGFEDYSRTPVDIDKKDDAYDPQTYASLRGIRMPDAVSAFTSGGTTYLVTANEGDGREWGEEELGTDYLNEDERDFGEEGVTSPTGAITAENSGLSGKVVFFLSDDYDGLDANCDYLFGGRTFTIFEVTENGLTEVFTSGDDFESLTAQYLPDFYNVSNDNAVLDDRSGKKGPEPESVTVGTVDGRTYAFVALERTGGVMVYDVTEPASAAFVNYINTRAFAATVEGSEVYEDGELDKWVTGGDVAPEGLYFIDSAASPTGEALLLAACEVSGTVSVYQVGGETITALPFTDVADSAWYRNAVAYVYDNGLMNGTTAVTFGPDVNTTRGMIVTILYRMEGEPDAGESSFTDVAAHMYYADAIAWAEQNGIVTGVSETEYQPERAITREEMAAILYRYAGYKGYDTTGRADLSGYADADAISPYAVEALQWAGAEELIQGVTTTTLEPQGSAIRSHVATMLMRLDQMIAE